MPVTVIQAMRRLVQFDFEFQCSGTEIDQQTRVARFQFDGDEIGNESLFRFGSHHRPVVEQSSVRLLCKEFDAEVGAFAHFQSRIPSPSATTEGTRRLLATGSVEPTRALAPTDETRKLQLAQTPNMMYKTQRT